MRKLLPFLGVFLLFAGANAQTVYYVDASKADNAGNGLSWPNAKKDLQEAINAATTDGDQIWVRAGTYFPTRSVDGDPLDSPRDKNFYIISKNIKVFGGFFGTETSVTARDPAANLTILSGDIGTVGTANDNCYHVLVTIARSSTCVIDGFTLQGGYASGLGYYLSDGGLEIDDSSGGGLYNHNGSPTISNCIIKNNWGRNGGGIRIAAGSPIISHCGFINNSALYSGGGISAKGSSVIDHCSFTGNTAEQWGAGIRIYENNTTLSNSVFTNNAALISGGGIEIDMGSANTMVSNCIFKGNTANSYGGAIDNYGISTRVVNSVFYSNTAVSRGGAINSDDDSNLTVNNCSFSGNQVSHWQGKGGGINYSGDSGGSLTNCILYNNTAPANGSDPNREEIYKGGTGASLTVSYSLIRDYSSGASNNYTAGSGIISGDPLFTNSANPIGIDGLWGTADDGLILKACSPVINAGVTTSPALSGDVFGNNRVAAYDIGAYEFQGPVAATVNAIITTSQQGTTTYGDCNGIVATITSAQIGGISGITTAKVWIESTQPSQFVKRHYEIAPETNASTSSGWVTLYFTQGEFNDFNAANSNKLPTGTSDATGKANLRIEKRAGRSSGGAVDASGMPNTYSGAVSPIDPADGDVVWNNILGRWEISFYVSGFSGFFVKTVSSSGALPVTLTDFEASRAEAAALLAWRTTSEVNSDYFGIERSINGKSWESIGKVMAMKESEDLRTYTFKDLAPQNGENLYRLKMVDGDGSFAYSRIRQLNFEAVGMLLYPNPANETVRVRVAPRYIGTEAMLLNASGKVLRRIRVVQENFTIGLDKEPTGVYLLQVNDGQSMKLIKQ